MSAPTSPVFLLGCPRSGTFALWSALVRHPRIVGPRKEPWFLQEFFGGREAARSAPLVDDAAALDRAYLRRFARMLDDFYREEFDVGTRRWISANPNDGLYLEELLELFPDARVLSLLRHPQEVVWSALHAPYQVFRVYSLSDEERIRCAVRMAAWWARFAEALDARSDERVLVVRHEELLARPEETVATCLGHLGEEPHAEVAASLGVVVNSSFTPAGSPARLLLDDGERPAGTEPLLGAIAEHLASWMDRFGFPDLADPEGRHAWRARRAELQRSLQTGYSPGS